MSKRRAQRTRILLFCLASLVFEGSAAAAEKLTRVADNVYAFLFTGYHPFLAEGDIAEWCGQLDDMQAMDVELIIPGHGPLSGKKDLAEMKQYLLAFDREAQALAARGAVDPGAATAAMLGVLPARPEGGWLVTANLTMKYLRK